MRGNTSVFRAELGGEVAWLAVLAGVGAGLVTEKGLAWLA